MARRLAILGSTGSIGRNALEVVRLHPGRFEVGVLSSHANIALLADQIREFHPAVAVVTHPESARELAAVGLPVRVLTGPEGLGEAAAIPVDVSLFAVVGAVGLVPMLRAIEAGNTLAVANKEPLVMAGKAIMAAAAARGVDILPVDSEHSAIFQCLNGRAHRHLSRIHLTASGGPFFGMPHAALRDVTPEQAAKHPTWDMGRKISVDSATLMNKGLEVIEAMALFDMPASAVDVVIHRQSVIHGLVEFTDGGLLAQLGPTDMRLPIELALFWPERAGSPMMPFDLTQVSALTFARPDLDAFPCLAMAYEAAKQGGAAPAVLNAANEVAVKAFLDRRISFTGIADMVRSTLDGVAAPGDDSLESALDADYAARRHVHLHLQHTGA